jgi:hypothetical protein
MDKQDPKIGIASLAYPEQDLLTTTEVLTWTIPLKKPCSTSNSIN